jgi:hypothetical protein
MRKKLKKLYLLYWCDFISVEAFASYIQAMHNNNCNSINDCIEVDEKKALRIINIGRKLYQRDYYV